MAFSKITVIPQANKTKAGYIDIQHSLAGQIVKSPKGYNAFVPDPLPPKLEWGNAVVNSLSQADFLLGKLARAGSQLPNPHLLLSLRLIKEIHEQLMQGVRGSHATPGELRRSQNWIEPPGYTMHTEKFVPPPPDDLMDCLEELESFLHDNHCRP